MAGPTLDLVRSPARLESLRQTRLLDSPPEAAFDRLARLAARLLGAPIALVTLVDEERQFFKSAVGLPEPWASARQTPLSHSFCQHVVMGRAPLAVEDAREHPLLRDNLAIRDIGVVAYLGVPLVTASGQALGSLSVISSEPRRWTEDEADLLDVLGGAVMTEVELRESVQLANDQAELAVAVAVERDELLENIPEALFTLDDEWRVLFANRKAAALLGLGRDALTGRELWSALPALGGSEFERGCRAAAAAGRETTFEASLPPLSQSFEVHAAPRAGALSVYFRDITARRLAEASLRQRDAELQQAQKMEAIGLLAGGVAHDFNNLLTVIRAHGEFLSSRLADDPDAQRDALDVVRAADRAAQLTRQLLAFSRRQALDPRLLRPAALVAELGEMLRRLIDADVRLEIDVDAPSGWAVADPSQLEQVVVNLAINARDAMPGGGTLSIAVRDVWVAADAEAEAGSVPGEVPHGPYVAITVRDTGCGMSPQVRRRAFEPFFTTKAPGRGTGLGLSMVYGIVRQSGGQLRLESAEGVGTTLTVLLPRVAGPAGEGAVAAGERPHRAAAAAPGSGTVLVVEDEDEVRAVVRQVLERAGYEVLEARHGVDAEALAVGHAGPIDLLLTDVVMPHMGGRELAARLRRRRPGIGVLYMSGYAPESAGLLGGGGGPGLDAPCIEKPFTMSALRRAVSERLGRPALPAPGERELSGSDAYY